MNIALRYAARSDVGLVRSNNQDSGYAGPHLLVVADGMGGHAGGDVASSIAIAALAPLAARAFGRWIAIPVVIFEIVLGIVLGPSALDNDRLHAVFAVNAAGMAIGILIVVRHLKDAALPWLAVAALAATALAALAAGALHGTAMLLVSQALVGLGTTMFASTALVYAIRRLRRHGSEYFATQITMFASSQTFGLLLGTAWSMQVVAAARGDRGAIPGGAAQTLYAAIACAAAVLAAMIAVARLVREKEQAS